MSKRKEKTLPPALDGFLADGWISEVVNVVKSGKEATVYCCKAAPGIPGEYLAAKIYRPQHVRSFKNNTIYREGRIEGNARDRRAVAKKSSYGREVEAALWTGAEYETLQMLHAAGAIVPRPLTCGESSMLMEYVGDGPTPGRPLYTVEMDDAEARLAFRLLLDNITLWMRCNIVHGDLSPYNILHTKARGITVIDFPQAVDPRFSPHARALLERDIENVVDYFEPYGARLNIGKHVNWLWGEWKMGKL